MNRKATYFSQCLVISLGFIPMLTFAELTAINDEKLSKTAAQAGITIGLDMVINKTNNDVTANKVCPENSGDCQFGIRLDNQNDPDLWLTATGVSGGLKIPKLNVESAEIGTTNKKQAVKMTYANKDSNKAVFSDFGYDSLRLSKDKTLANGQISGGYRNAVPFGTGLDAGRQSGFLGMRIHGKATMTGSITIFNCGSC